MTYFHITSQSNWLKIQKQGLVPKKQKRGQGFEETQPAIYLFNTKEEACDGFCNWLEDCFDEAEEIVLLEVHISSDRVEPDPELPLSCSICLSPIDSSCIAFVEIM